MCDKQKWRCSKNVIHGCLGHYHDLTVHNLFISTCSVSVLVLKECDSISLMKREYMQ